VIVAQLIRNDVVRVPEGFRLQEILGLTHAPPLPTPALVVIGLAAAAAIVAVSARAASLAGAPPPALDWFATLTLALVVVAFLWPADFYPHYGAFVAPFLALSIALPVSRLLGALSAASQSAAGDPPLAAQARRWRLSAGVTAAVAVAAFAVLQGFAEHNLVSVVPAAELSATQRAIPPGSCVLTDQVSYTIAINRFVSRVPGCSIMVDGVGSDYALSGGRNGVSGAGRFPAVRALWWSGFRSAQFIWLTGQANRRIPWTPQLLVYLHAHFRALTEGPNWLYVRQARA
jgi:hypothetical protein